jgi:hypothetical protein
MTKRQTIQLPKEKRYTDQMTNDTMGHCSVCLLAIVLFVFWSLYRLSFGHSIAYLMAIVSFVFGHCIACPLSIVRQTLQWPNDKQYNGQRTTSTMANGEAIQ